MLADKLVGLLVTISTFKKQKTSKSNVLLTVNVYFTFKVFYHVTFGK